MAGNLIQEYLVGLGVKIDRPGFNELNNTINTTTRTIESATSGWRREFTAAAGVVTASLAGITTAVGGLMKNVADQDLAMEKLARNMMVSKDAAWEMKKATDALGESINDIAITPELMERYQKLIADGKNMKVGGDFAQTMRSFRDLMFEFTRLKQEVSYAMTWVGYYLLKYLNRPLSEAQAKFRSFNDMFIRNMSVWTEKAARALVYIINIGLHFATFIKELTTNIYDMWMAFPRGIKIATAAVTAFFALIKMSPMGRMITVVSTLLLLLDDYFGYFEGKDALLGKYWEKLHYFIEMAKEKIIEFADAAEPILDTFVEYVKKGADAMADLGMWILSVADEVRNSVAFEEFCQTFERLGRALYSLANGIFDFLVGNIHALEDSFSHNESGERFTEVMDTLYHIFLGLVDAISYCVEVLAGWLEEAAQSETVRDLADAVAELVNAQLELIDAIATLVKTVMVEFFHDMDDTEPVYAFRDAIRFVVKIITVMIRAVAWVIKKLAQFLKMMTRSETFKNFWRDLGHAVKEFGKGFGYVIDQAIDKLGRFGRALKALMAGDVKGAIAALFTSSGKGGGGPVAKQAWALAQQIGAERGVDPEIIYGQWYHETGGFTSRLTKENNNLAGLKGTNGEYMSFSSIDEFANYFNRIWGPYIAGATSPEDYASKLKREGYFTDGYENYVAGIKGGMQHIPSSDSDSSGGESGERGGDFGKSNLRKWSSAHGDTDWDDDSGGSSGTDTNHFQEYMVAFLDTLNAAAREAGIAFTITGGSEPGHASGTYSHGNGYKVDISDEISPQAEQVLFKAAEQFGATVSHEISKGHYDITVKPEGEGTFEVYNSLVGAGNSLRHLRHYSRGVAMGMNRLMGDVDPVVMSGMMSSQGAVTNYGATNNTYNTYHVDVGDVNVAQTNASPAEIGRAVADQSIDALQRRGQYIYKNRVLTGGQNLV